MSLSWPTKLHNELILPVAVSQASIESISTLVWAQPPFDLLILAAVAPAAQVVTEEKGEVLVGLKGLVIVFGSSDFEGVNHPCPSIRELVGDLDKTWGNSKE